MLGRTDKLSGIISTFTNTVAKLDALIAENGSAISRNSAQIASLQLGNEDLSGENEKALSIRQKIAALIE
jgi:hypothetical protein